MPAAPQLDLSALPNAQLEAMLAAGDAARVALHELAGEGLHPVSAALRGAGEMFEYEHYPAGDVYDPRSRSQYYYHSHGAEGAAEHGHFHTFARLPGRLPAQTHLVALGMSAEGRPLRLFTTNRWVTDERWQHGRDLMALLDRFAIAHAAPHPALNRWLGAMLRLFRPQIDELVRRRDAALAAAARGRAPAEVLEDRALEVLSEAEISLDGQMRRLRRALG